VWQATQSPKCATYLPRSINAASLSGALGACAALFTGVGAGSAAFAACPKIKHAPRTARSDREIFIAQILEKNIVDLRPLQVGTPIYRDQEAALMFNAAV
jgi:hypothetical protein